MALTAEQFQPGTLVRARGREWVVLPETRDQVLKLRPLGGSEEDATLIYLPLEPTLPESATFPRPDPSKSGSQAAGLLMRDAVVYPKLADKYLGRLASRLRGVNQPVIRTRNGFPAPAHPSLACP
jgi:hypothetical protein